MLLCGSTSEKNKNSENVERMIVQDQRSDVSEEIQKRLDFVELNIRSWLNDVAKNSQDAISCEPTDPDIIQTLKLYRQEPSGWGARDGRCFES